MTTFKTEQERFWAGEFGNQYTARNQNNTLIASNIALFSKIFTHTQSIRSVIELGANLGLNLQAIQQLLPNAELSAVEINQTAIAQLKQFENMTVYPQSILDFQPPKSYDFVLIKGVLIHINPKYLPQVYTLLHDLSSRYICIAEYYNPTPVEVPYRGHQGKLFKRDFAGELLDRFQNIQLVDYGFVYRRDRHFPQDDINWFLLEKL